MPGVSERDDWSHSQTDINRQPKCRRWYH
jgi:hypothetical protein